MKTKLLFIGLLIASISIQAQLKTVALHKATGTDIFTGADPFNEAYTASVSGDTIYLSGGSFVAPSNFEKQLVIYGVGHYPDSTAATNPTVITGDFILTANADNFYLEGVNLKNDFLTVSDHSVDRFTLRRVKIDGNISIQGTLKSCSNISFIECIIGAASFYVGTKVVLAENMTNSVFFNNIIYGIIQSSDSNFFYNNIFCNDTIGYFFDSSNNNEISNNVMYRNGLNILQGTANTFRNNIILAEYNYFDPTFGDSPNMVNNYFGENLNVLVSVNPSFSQEGIEFSYEWDYHLADPVTYLGTDGTEVGIYGGAFPFKTANVPAPPHISTKNISTSTDSNGNLNVNIKVNAQKN